MSVRRPPFVQDHVPTHGTRDAKFITLHTTEGIGTVESYAAYFRRTADELGSSFLVEQKGRVGIYVATLDQRTYHVKGHNSDMIGIEQAGFARTSRNDWLTKYRRQLMATAWTIAWLCDELSIPCILAANNKRQMLHTKGVLQHSQVPGNDHTDCGPGYPIDQVMEWAQKWTRTGGPTRGTRLYIKTGIRLSK